MIAPVELRIPAVQGHALRRAIAQQANGESVAFALASHATVSGKTLLLVQVIRELPADGYIPTPHHGAKWRGGAMLPILNEAMRRGCGIFVCHLHPHTGPVELSLDDRDSAQKVLPT